MRSVLEATMYTQSGELMTLPGRLHDMYIA